MPIFHFCYNFQFESQNKFSYVLGCAEIVRFDFAIFFCSSFPMSALGFYKSPLETFLSAM